MHGRIIQVKKAVGLRDKLIASKKPNDVKKIAPWVKPSNIKGKKTSALNVGMSIPPYHFNCRTRTVVVLDDDPDFENMEMGENVSKDHKDKLLSRTSKEHASRVGEILSRDGLKWNEVDFSDDILKIDIRKHANEFDFNTNDYIKYNKKAQNIIKNSTYITAQVYKGEIQYLFYSIEESGYAIVDQSFSIRGAYGHKELEKTFNGRRGLELWLS